MTHQDNFKSLTSSVHRKEWTHVFNARKPAFTVALLLLTGLPLFTFSAQSAERYIINGVPIENVAAEPATAGVASTVENSAHSAASAKTKPAMSSVNINTASVDELDQGLSGIGRRKAEAIVEYRTRHGAFSDVRQLLEVKGIGEGILKKNRERISL
ncbi:ComEA family DNA-binding protein [Plesiomonas shigelloides]|uniref:ComEA family DNA-binding protein n=1 Tax=Plesiomonas shigelloides TaxID=703 RepID=UPI001E29C265|nr:ComEA family DNA-binding protein [Plesiomonas shigelloides]